MFTVNNIVSLILFRFYIKFHTLEIGSLLLQVILPYILCDCDQFLCCVGFTGELYADSCLDLFLCCRLLRRRFFCRLLHSGLCLLCRLNSFFLYCLCRGSRRFLPCFRCGRRCLRSFLYCLFCCFFAPVVFFVSSITSTSFLRCSYRKTIPADSAQPQTVSGNFHTAFSLYQ